MFTAQDLQAIINTEIDENIDDEDMIIYVNTCLLDLCELFRKTGTQEIIVTDTEEFIERTDGHLSVVGITCNGKKYTGKWELNYDRTKIRFGEPGTFTVTSIVIPDMITSVTDPIGVHDVFKIGIARYIAALFDLMDNDQDPEGLRMKTEAEGLIRRASNMLLNSDKRSGQSIPFAERR